MLGITFGSIGGYFGLVAVLEAYFVAAHGASGLIAATAIVSFLIALAGLWAYREFTMARRGRYANLGASLHGVNHEIRNLSTYLEAVIWRGGDIQPEELRLILEVFKSRLVNVLNNIQNIFQILTGSSCRACIKTFYYVEGNLYISTLARDDNSNKLYREVDYKREKENNDPLNSNTYIKTVTLDNIVVEPVILINDLRRAEGFDSTSYRAYSPGFENKLDPKRSTISQKWPLPYRSKLAYAIRQSAEDSLLIDEATVLGVLCVDCSSRNVFSHRWDIPLMAALADSLFHVLFKYFDLQEMYNRLSTSGAEENA